MKIRVGTSRVGSIKTERFIPLMLEYFQDLDIYVERLDLLAIFKIQKGQHVELGIILKVNDDKHKISVLTYPSELSDHFSETKYEVLDFILSLKFIEIRQILSKDEDT